MPARRRSERVVEEPPNEQESLLRFHEPLSWRAGKAIPIADLLTRLQKLAKELRSLEPEGEVAPQSVAQVAQDLASPNLLAHKDKGIRAWTACCVVDLLRICVPHAPFRGPQLKDIFSLVVNYIIPQLADPSNAYNAQHLYVLTSLAEVHSIALITDLERPEQLILNLLTAAFDIVSGSAKASTGEEVTKVVEGYLTKISVQVIEEMSSVSAEVTDVIIAQFIRVDPRTEPQAGKKKNGVHDGSQSNLLHKTYPRAYLMAKAICSSIPERMTSHISQYFNNVIMDASEKPANSHSKDHNRHGSFGEADEEAGDLKEVRKAHRLIRELWRACPDVLQHVIPQVEQELSAASAPLRSIATETLADVAAGIGVAGCPPPLSVDPASYPPQSLSDALPSLVQDNMLQIPMSPKPFSQVHASAYESFLGRKQDKAATVRAVWATGAGQILLTSAGGIGFVEGEEKKLRDGLAQLLADADDKVRLAAIKSLGRFGFGDVMGKLAPHGSVSTAGSILGTLSDRVRDRKNSVRREAMYVLARMWASAAGEIEAGNAAVIVALGDAPSKLLDAIYVNDPEVHLLVDQVLFECLLPLSYPPTKFKKGKQAESQSDDFDADMIRVRRMLTFLQSLDDKAKKVFFGMQGRQTQFSRVMAQFLKACEDYNGGVVEEKGQEAEAKKELNKWVDAIAKTLPDSSLVAADLHKFAKMHDRRNYQLIRFCMNPESDYRTVVKAIKELSKRIQGRSGNTPSLDTLTPLLYRCSLLVYNRSHVPGIVKTSRDEGGLAESAHELLKEMSTRTPEVLKSHVQELCKDLEATAPTATMTEEASAPDMLKACAEFARRFPAEIPRDRKFLAALTNYALFSRSPVAAKHAVSIMMASDRKEMYAKELMAKATKDCTYSSTNFLTRLATISQINLLEPRTAEEACEMTIRITTQEVLMKNRHPTTSDTYTWSSTPDNETLAKEWALKCLVNFLRSQSDDSPAFSETASSLYTLLTRLISQEGELGSAKDTPPHQRSYLRLVASRLLIKLCSKQRACEDLVTPSLFNAVALVAHDRLVEVRAGFTAQLKKYLGLDRLNTRWYTVLFLAAFEPDQKLKSDTLAWLRSRATALARRQQQSSQPGAKTGAQNTMEIMLARLLSLLAHHPDFPDSEPETAHAELLDFAHYIVFYLQAVATDTNLSLIFHVAQRVKQAADGISKSDEADERLYTLSDLAQAVIRHYADFGLSRGASGKSSGVNLLQTWPGKMRLPLSLFRGVANHVESQRIADRNYLPEEVAAALEKTVRSTLRPGKDKEVKEARKRKPGPDADSDSDTTPVKAKKAKKAKKKATSLPVRKADAAHKTPRPRKSSLAADTSSPALPSRKSARRSAVAQTNYDEGDSDDDDAEMEAWEQLAGEKKADKANGGMDVDMHDAEAGENQDPDQDTGSAPDEPAEDEDDDEEEGSEAEGSPTPAPIKAKGKRPANGKAKTEPPAPRSSSKALSRSPAQTPSKSTPKPRARSSRAAAVDSDGAVPASSGIGRAVGRRGRKG